MQLTDEQFKMHCRDYDGYCTVCDDITRWGDTEPDAEGYPCEECGEDSCYGIEQAMILGHVEVSPPPDEEEKDLKRCDVCDVYLNDEGECPAGH